MPCTWKGSAWQCGQLRWWEFGPEHLRTMEDLFHLDFAAEPKQAVERLRYWIQQYRQEA